MKSKIRKEIAALKKEHTKEWKEQASSCIASKVLELQEYKQASTILLYFALSDEVQTLELIKSQYHTKRIALPLVVGDQLALKLYDPQKLVPGYKGILEPSAEAEDIAPADIDLALIPGVAFDHKCNRLGRGGGFYDRLIPQLKCPLVGLAYNFQIITQVPCESFDRPLHKVISEEIICQEQPSYLQQV